MFYLTPNNIPIESGADMWFYISKGTKPTVQIMAGGRRLRMFQNQQDAWNINEDGLKIFHPITTSLLVRKNCKLSLLFMSVRQVI